MAFDARATLWHNNDTHLVKENRKSFEPCGKANYTLKWELEMYVEREWAREREKVCVRAKEIH